MSVEENVVSRSSAKVAEPVFKNFVEAVRLQFKRMTANHNVLFLTNVERDELWEAYLSSFPAGTDELFRERTSHECNTCKQFIRPFGNVVAIKDGELISIWDVETEGFYQDVANKMSELVKSRAVKDLFVSGEAQLGTAKNYEQLASGKTKTWNHFNFKLPVSFVNRTNKSEAEVKAAYRDTKNVFRRSLEEISLDATETVLELIYQNSIERGAEFKGMVESFVKFKKHYDGLAEEVRDNYCWTNVSGAGAVSKMRNTVIGTLLSDISEGRDLDKAVFSFENKMDPTKFKRPRVVTSKKMIEAAQAKVIELGLENSLGRRYAKVEDITVNNVLFADRDAKKSMAGNVFEEMIEEVAVSPKKFGKVEEISMRDFLENVVPTATGIELFLENKHLKSLMSLVAPTDSSAPSMLKWPNNFGWAYDGDVADSLMKQNVKKAGGNVNGVLRFSIQWNDGDNNQNDFDAHCHEPGGNLIYFSSMKNHSTGGVLDVDIQSPGRNIAVENITWPDINKMEQGKYTFLVHNYSHNGGRTGFKAEIEYNGEIHSFEYDKELRGSEKVVVAEIEFSRKEGIKFVKSLDSTVSSKEAWGVSTNNFHKVSMVMNSPNHWNDIAIGNKHTFFILDGCKNEGTPRGFFNEFLNEELMEHKRVFEALGSKMRVEESDSQLSGIGLSSTKKNDVVLKVTGKTTRMLKVVN